MSMLNGGIGSTSMAKREMDLNKLYEMFPSVERQIIQDIYKQSNCELDASVEKLLSLPPKTTNTNSPTSSLVEAATPATTANNSLTNTAWSAVNTIASTLKGTLQNGGHFQQQQGSSSLQQPTPRSEDESIASFAKVVKENKQIMVILRGIPGSGKSYLAKKLKTHFGGIIASADDFFIRNGEYVFDPDQLRNAHDWCYGKVIDAANNRTSLIIVDNTNLESWEMLPYVKIALEHQYHIELLEPPTAWKYNLALCSDYNRHGIPYNKIVRLKDRFDRTITVEKLVQNVLLQFPYNYDVNQPPYSERQHTQPRQIPSSGQHRQIQLQQQEQKLREQQQQQQLFREQNQRQIQQKQKELQELFEQQQQKQQRQQQNPSVRPKSTTFGAPSVVNPNPPTVRSTIKSYSGHTDWQIPSYPEESRHNLNNNTSTPATKVRDSSSQTDYYAQSSSLFQSNQAMMEDEPMDCGEIGSNVRHVFHKTANMRLDKSTSCVPPVEPTPTNRDEQLQILLSKFPDVQLDTLSDIIDTCEGNIKWAIEVLSGDASELDDIITLSDDSSTESGAGCNFNAIINRTRQDEFELEIPPTFAHDLEMAFGQVDLNSLNHRKVRISSDLAKRIYDIWNKQCQSYVPNASSNSSNALRPPKGEFEEQQQLEEALLESKRYTNVHVNPELTELYKKFPGCSEEILDQIFFENDQNLKNTIEAVSLQVAAGTSTNNDVKWSRVAATIPQVSPTQEAPETGDYFIEEDAHFTELRDDLLKKRNELFEQKKNALDSKRVDVANYYTEEINKINREYQWLINAFVQYKRTKFSESNRLDLHGNTVKEAHSLFKAFIASKQSEVDSRGLNHLDLEIVTGWGLHSPKMKGSLFSSVLQFCKQRDIDVKSRRKGSLIVRLYKTA